MKNFTLYFYVGIATFLCAGNAFGASCPTGYSVAAHGIEWDFNIANPEYPSAIDAVNKALNVNTFIPSDDGNCYAGYEPYTRGGNDIYPLIEDSGLCEPGYYRANGNCTAYTSGGCPTGRYNAAVVNTTFVSSDDGNCYTGYEPYTRGGGDIYPLVDTDTLCGAGQYRANGTCTYYSNGTCPDGMRNTTLNASSWTTMTNGACPSNYSAYTIGTIEYACDTYVSHIDSNTPACLLMCTNGNIYTEVNSCASLCANHHKLMTSTGLEFPLYATKQITPSINIQMGNSTCYVNLVNGESTNAINVQYDNKIYHTVK